MQLEEVDIIGAEPAQAAIDGVDQVKRDEPTSFGPSPERKVALVEMSTLSRRPLIGRAEDFLRRAAGIDIGGVEHVEPGLEADVDKPRRLRDIGGAPGLEELAFAAKGAACRK